MSAHRQHAHLDAPLDVVWELVGTPSSYPEWWPRVIEVRGERFEEGDEYAQVTKDPIGRTEASFLLERRDDLRGIRMSCQLTGMYAEWRLMPAQGGTFVEVEMGMEARRLGDRIFDRALGNSYFRRWSSASLDGLREAALRRHERAPRSA
jgi:Polyketide cyclase / dehydrase and lipid transport